MLPQTQSREPVCQPSNHCKWTSGFDEHLCLVLESILVLYMLWFSWSVVPLLKNSDINEMSSTKSKPVLIHCRRITWKKLLCVFSWLIIFFLCNFKTHMNLVIFSIIYFCRKTGMSVIIQCIATDKEKKIQTM